MYLAKTPEAIKPFTADLTWNFSRTEKSIYFTFDDGPTPGVTEEVLDILKSYNALATFFCIGGNVANQPEIYQRILDEGHSVGNHTWNHMSGWEYSNYSYYRNILECAKLVKSSLFRPPYGRITRKQVKSLKGHFQLIMWDVLSGDWKQKLDPEKCLLNVIGNGRQGSVVVMHDSIKAKKNMLYALPRSIEHFTKLGYQLKRIETD